MGEISLTPESITAISRELTQNLHDQGLVVVHKSVAHYGFGFMQKRNAVLKLQTVTPSMIVKYQLLNKVRSVSTIKNMVKDGRIAKTEWLINNNVLHIIIAAIHRLNDE